MMVRRIIVLLLAMSNLAWGGIHRKGEDRKKDYLILAGKSVQEDIAWRKIVRTLQGRHHAKVFVYENSLSEALDELRRMRPRYVAVVEKPEKIDTDFITAMHRLSRKVTPGIYADFIWGIITGIDADAALKMLHNSERPLVIKSALTLQKEFPELTDGKRFDKFAYVSFGESGLKMSPADTVAVEKWNSKEQFDVFTKLYRRVAPDFMLCESFGYPYTFALPNPSVYERIYAENGNFFRDTYSVKYVNKKFVFGDTVRMPVDWRGNTKVYIAAGSMGCDVERPERSTALAWMNASGVASMVGYPPNSWFGQAVWGGLKFWIATPGRYTMAEAYFLSQQHILRTLNDFSPVLNEISNDYTKDANAYISEMRYEVQEKTGKKITDTKILGFLHERDLLAYFGDPKWDVRFQPEKEEEYSVKIVKKRKKCIITIKTKDNFNNDKLGGDFIREDFENSMFAPPSIGAVPFSVLFPERLKNPHLASGQEWNAAVSEDMLLLYEAWFEPGKTYKITLLTD